MSTRHTSTTNSWKSFIPYKGACELLEISKSELEAPVRDTQCTATPKDEIGVYGFVKYDICRLHNLLYHEGRNRTANAWKNPWA